MSVRRERRKKSVCELRKIERVGRPLLIDQCGGDLFDGIGG